MITHLCIWFPFGVWFALFVLRLGSWFAEWFVSLIGSGFRCHFWLTPVPIDWGIPFHSAEFHASLVSHSFHSAEFQWLCNRVT